MSSSALIHLLVLLLVLLAVLALSLPSEHVSVIVYTSIQLLSKFLYSVVVSRAELIALATSGVQYSRSTE
jgi:ABC-type Zn uptake system ZnuABC Zn-binding protein ZnuA